MRSAKRVFTLVELLVIVAIVLLLAALLLPSLQKARETGKRMKCLGSIRQVGFCWLNYASDYHGFMYPNSSVGFSGWKSGNQSFEKLYQIKTSAMSCPSGVIKNSYGASAHYSLNHDRLKNTENPLGYGHGLIGKIQSPSKKLAFCDYGTDSGINSAYGTVGWSIPTINYVPGAGDYPPTAVNVAAGGTATTDKAFFYDFMNGRHLKSISIFHVDGHASSMQILQFAPQFYSNPSATGTLFKSWNVQ